MRAAVVDSEEAALIQLLFSLWQESAWEICNMEFFVVFVFVVFIGTLLYCVFDTIRHANKRLPPKSD